MITPKRKDRNLQIMLDSGIVAVIRAQSSEQLIHVVKALREGGVKAIKICRRYSTIIVPGAYTPTEILTAWEAGADIVKVFPATSLGASYFKDVLAPLPQVRMSPTGGVDLNSVTDFIKAGAACVAIGGNLVTKKALAEQDWASITSTAQAFIQKIKEARQPS
jgi:2-dehydro-3-deoxyphosphogluconate aldolase/(4S)-4-hydroxy-2-oxoglutarate aldolase